MTDIARWLEGFGLGRYAGVFAENGIGTDILTDLTEADFRGMGIMLGDRKRLLRAVAALGTADAPAEITPTPQAREPAGGVQAWRRQLTVLFCDLVASSTMAASVDIEDLQRTIRSFQDTCAGVIVRSGGYVARFMGDGLLAYFGYPLAYEDSAERAVRAGIELVGQISSLRSTDGEQLHVRFGIATGLVVGETIGDHAAREDAVVGETPNVAARLQALAAPDTVYIAGSTQRLLGKNFICEDRGAQVLKGLPGQVHVWQVLGERTTGTRFEAQQSGHLTAFVGRERELAHLRELWIAATSGSGRVALINGEAGIGKSRICQRFVESVADRPHFLVQLQCSPQHVDTPFYPVIRHLECSANFAVDDRPEVKLDKVAALLTVGGPEKPAYLPIYAALLSIPSCGRFPPLELTPEELRNRTIETIIWQISDLSRIRPVIFIVEDAHWIDPSTLEFIMRFVETVPTLPVMMLLTFRPEFQPPWLDRSFVSVLRCNRLGRGETDAIVSQVAGNKSLPQDILDQIGLKTDGVPMFIEEITKAVLESGVLGEQNGQYVPSRPLQALSIPATLHDSLMARLDRLATARDVAQIGAAIGREFSYRLLAAVCSPPRSDLPAALTQLTAAELIFSRGVAPDSSYTFKHALVQDAAYESLLHSHRRQLHGRIADALREHLPDSAETQPQLVAHHLEAAGRAADAVAYLRTASERAMARSAMAEAKSLLHRALDLQSTLPAGPETRQRTRALEALLSRALIAGSGYAAGETRAALRRANNLIDADTPADEQMPILYGLWVAAYVESDADQQRRIGAKFMAQAVRHGENRSLWMAHRLLGTTHFTTGEFRQALSALDRARELCGPALQRSGHSRFSQETGTSLLCYKAMTLWQLGRLDEARTVADSAVERARHLADAFSLTYAIAHAVGLIAMFRRDPDATRPCAAEGLPLAEQYGFTFWTAGHRIINGWAMTSRKDFKVGLREMTEGLQQWEGTDARLWLSFFLAARAEAFAAIGHHEEASADIERALKVSEETGERWADPEVLRIKASLLVRSKPREGAREAESLLLRSIEVATAQGGLSWRLRASCDLAALLQARGQDEQALALLTDAYASFGRNYDEPDLNRARELIRTLQAASGRQNDHRYDLCRSAS
ncbi:MAG: AAA family ATPase [Acetobacteraceae bacterium]|nr:AAA family ATPase [Acetobacteraceae bacterium]